MGAAASVVEADGPVSKQKAQGLVPEEKWDDDEWLKACGDGRTEVPALEWNAEMERRVVVYTSDIDESDESEDDYDEEANLEEMKQAPVVAPKGRRNTVFAAAGGTSKDWKPPVFEKDEVASRFIEEQCMSSFLFNRLEKSELPVLVGAFELTPVSASAVVIKQGDENADKFYLVQSGEFTIEKDGELLLTLKDAGMFGELALLYDAPRAATVKAVGEGVLWALDRVTFKSILCKSSQHKSEQRTAFLKEVQILQCLDDYARLRLADALTETNFAEGAVIINEGDHGGTMFIIEAGEVKYTKDGVEGEVSERSGSGAYFGEIALLANDVRQATVTAVAATRCLAVDRGTFKRLLGGLEETLKKKESLYKKFVTDKA